MASSTGEPLVCSVWSEKGKLQDTLSFLLQQSTYRLSVDLRRPRDPQSEHLCSTACLSPVDQMVERRTTNHKTLMNLVPWAELWV